MRFVFALVAVLFVAGPAAGQSATQQIRIVVVPKVNVEFVRDLPGRATLETTQAVRLSVSESTRPVKTLESAAVAFRKAAATIAQADPGLSSHAIDWPPVLTAERKRPTARLLTITN